MSIQLSIFDAIEGQRLADEKLNHAVQHADKKHPGWKERCWNLFVKWIMNKPPGYHFMIEDFRIEVVGDNMIEKPGSDRAYGFLSKKARDMELIVHAGTAQVKNPKAHRANANMWCVV